MKKIRLTESDLMRIVRRVIVENKKQTINEGIGTVLGISAISALGYAIYKFKKILDKYGKFIPLARLTPFLAKIKSIENGDINMKVVVKEKDDYKIIAIVDENGDVFDSITIDMVNDEVYSNHDVLSGKQPKSSNKIIPMVLPIDADKENIEKIQKAEDELVDELLKIILKHKKQKFDPEMFR